MKVLKRIGIWFSIYVLMSVGAVMAVQHSWWWMLPSVVSITLGLQLVEYYARNWSKFNCEHNWVEIKRYIDVSSERAYNVIRYKCKVCGEYKEEKF